MKFFIAFLLTLFFAAATTAAPQVTIHSISVLEDNNDNSNDDDTGINIVELDDMNLARLLKKRCEVVKTWRNGFARLSRVGLTLQKGESGTFHAKIRTRALTTKYLASLTKKFEKKLTPPEKQSLRILKQKYNGGFDIPWLQFVGINLEKKAVRGHPYRTAFQPARPSPRCELAKVARNILKKTVPQKIDIHVSLQVHGVSFIPTTVFPFLKIAKLYLTDKSRLVVSEHDTVVGATSDGKVVPTTNKEIEIVAL